MDFNETYTIKNKHVKLTRTKVTKTHTKWVDKKTNNVYYTVKGKYALLTHKEAVDLHLINPTKTKSNNKRNTKTINKTIIVTTVIIAIIVAACLFKPNKTTKNTNVHNKTTNSKQQTKKYDGSPVIVVNELSFFCQH